MGITLYEIEKKLTQQKSERKQINGLLDIIYSRARLHILSFNILFLFISFLVVFAFYKSYSFIHGDTNNGKAFLFIFFTFPINYYLYKIYPFKKEDYWYRRFKVNDHGTYGGLRYFDLKLQSIELDRQITLTYFQFRSALLEDINLYNYTDVYKEFSQFSLPNNLEFILKLGSIILDELNKGVSTKNIYDVNKVCEMVIFYAKEFNKHCFLLFPDFLFNDLNSSTIENEKIISELKNLLQKGNNYCLNSKNEKSIDSLLLSIDSEKDFFIKKNIDSNSKISLKSILPKLITLLLVLLYCFLFVEVTFLFFEMDFSPLLKIGLILISVFFLIFILNYIYRINDKIEATIKMLF